MSELTQEWKDKAAQEIEAATKALIELKYKYGYAISYYEEKAIHIEGTETCSVTLPCRYANKDIRLFVVEKTVS